MNALRNEDKTSREATSMRLGAGMLVALVVLATLCLPPSAYGGLGGALARGATKGVTRSLRGGSAWRVFRRDLLRDRGSRVRRLAEPRRVFRYTTKPRAQEELQSGIAPGRHMASRANPGRPPSATTAQEKYGLLKKPEVRETVKLPAGQPVQLNRVIGGEAGYGEITSSKRVPPGAIEKTLPLR